MTAPTTEPTSTTNAAAWLGGAVYLLAVAVGVAVVHNDAGLVSAWLAFAGATGLGGSLFSKVKSVQASVGSVAESVGPTNGQNVSDTVNSILRLEEYSHTQTHELRASLAKVAAVVPVVMARFDRLENHLGLPPLPSSSSSSSSDAAPSSSDAPGSATSSSDAPTSSSSSTPTADAGD